MLECYTTTLESYIRQDILTILTSRLQTVLKGRGPGRRCTDRRRRGRWGPAGSIARSGWEEEEEDGGSSCWCEPCCCCQCCLLLFSVCEPFLKTEITGMSDCSLAGKITKSAFCLVFTCHCNCSMLGLSFIIVIPHVDILQFHLDRFQ